jgi:hypothetical protein
MLHEARQGHVVRARQLGDRPAPLLERSKNLAPRAVGQRREEGVELVIRILNH